MAVKKTQVKETTKLNNAAKLKQLADELKQSTKTYYRGAELEGEEFEILSIEEVESEEYGTNFAFEIKPKDKPSGIVTLKPDDSRNKWFQFYQAGGNLLNEFGLFTIRLIPAKNKRFKPYARLVPLGQEDAF